MAQSDSAPVIQDDNRCDRFTKLKHCRGKLLDQYKGLVYRVWQWNKMSEELSNVVELVIKDAENGNGDSQEDNFEDSKKKRKEILEEILENWERCFDKKIGDEEFVAVFAKCKEVLTKLGVTLSNEEPNLTSIQNKIQELIVISKLQGQLLTKQCGNGETHKVSSALQTLHEILTTKTQQQHPQSLAGIAGGSSIPAQEQPEKKKKSKDAASSVDSCVKKIVDFACQKLQSFVQNLQVIFSPEGAESFKAPKDVIQWTEACVNAHGALIAFSSVKELDKSTQLYKNVKELFNNEDSKTEIKQKIQLIMKEFTFSSVNFLKKVMHMVEGVTKCLPDEKFKSRGKELKKSLSDSEGSLQLVKGKGERDRLLQVKKKLQDIPNMRKTLEDAIDSLQKMGICGSPLDTSVSPQDPLKIVEELLYILTDGQLFSMLTECHKKVNDFRKERINLETQGNQLTPEERKEKKEKCAKTLENCSKSLAGFVASTNESEIVTCTQCYKAEECREVNKALKTGKLSKENISFIRSSLHAAYSSKEWQETRMLNQVVESLKCGKELEPESRKYLNGLLSEWHENCYKSKEAETCKLAKEALGRANSAYLVPEQRRFILRKLEKGNDPLYMKVLVVFKKGPDVEGALQQQLLEIVTKWYNDFLETGAFIEMERTKDTNHQDCVDIYKLYEAIKSQHTKGPLDESVCKILLGKLVDPSQEECCKKILDLSDAFIKLENCDLSEEQKNYLLGMFPVTATCKRCSAMGTHVNRNKESEQEYWTQLRKYLESNPKCENCEEMLHCMEVYQVLSQNKDLTDDQKGKVVDLLSKCEDKWKCEEEINCIEVIQKLSKGTAKDKEDVEKYVSEKLKKGNPCEYNERVFHESYDELLNNLCKSCFILMEQCKVRKTLQENKFLANNLRNNICDEFFPNTAQCKECHQWVDCVKMLDAKEILSENQKKSVYHILNSTEGCEDCTHSDGDVDNSELKQIVAKGVVAAKAEFMKAIKDRWERALHCKVCHRNLIHFGIQHPGYNSEDAERLKNFLREYLKQFEHRLHCEVCEEVFVPEDPFVIDSLTLKDIYINPSGCSKMKDIKSFQQAASNQLKEHGVSLEDTFVYPSETKTPSGKSKQEEAANDKGAKNGARKKGRSRPASESNDPCSNCNVGDALPSPQSLSEQLNMKDKQGQEGTSDKKRRNCQDTRITVVGGTSGASGEQSKDASRTRRFSAPYQLTLPGPISPSPNRKENIISPPNYFRCDSTDLHEHSGIDQVVEIFLEWGKAHNDIPLCILREYNYSSLRIKGKAFRHTITKSSGDFDILVISRHLGVILVEMKAIKSKGTNLKKELGKAQRQLQKNKMVFCEMNRDWVCPSRIPVISLIAVPNTTCQELKINGICQKDRQQILSKCMIQGLRNKPRELDKLIGIPNSNLAFSDNEYYTIMTRLFGLDNLIKYHHTDDRFIRDTGKKMFGMLLTKDQKSLIQSDKNQFQILAGDYGTGKTLMLAEKAKMVANSYRKKQGKKKKIMVISCTDITVDGKCLKKGQPEDSMEHVRNFIGDNSKERKFNYFDHIELHMARSFIKGHIDGGDIAESLRASIAAIASSEDSELHLLFDEMPLNFMKEFKDKLQSLLERYRSVLKTLWVSIATHSFRVTVLKKQDPKWIKSDCPDVFEFCYLTKNLRVPGRVLDLHKAIEWINGDGHVDTKRGDIPLGPMPLLYRVPKCVCPNQSNPSNEILRCKCSKVRMKETLKRLFLKINILQEDEGKISKSDKDGPRSVVMLLFAVESQSFRKDVRKLLLESCAELGIEVEDRTYLGAVRHLHVPYDEEIPVGNRGSSSVQCNTEKEKGWSSTSNQVTAGWNLDNPNPEYKGKNGDREDCKKPKEASKRNSNILLTTETSFIGCEGEVVICVDLNGMLHWYPNSKLAYTTSGISRCLSQYIHLTWMPTEAEKMFREQMEHLIEDGDVKREDVERALNLERGTCLERVLNQILIEEQEVEMPQLEQE